MPTSKPVVIMGAGPAGLTAAWDLVRAGREIVVWEADASYVGGLSRTVQAEGFRIDIGGHRFFSKSADVLATWKQILPDEMIESTFQARMFYKSKLLTFPLVTMEVVKQLGLTEAYRLRHPRVSAREWPADKEMTFTDWGLHHFGRRVFDLFLAPYAKKIWGLPAEEISGEWPRESRDGLLLGVASAQGKTAPVSGQHFLYPRLGPGQLWEAAANRVLERGGQIFLDRKVQTVHWNETGVTHITGTTGGGGFFQQEGSHFLSSLPLRELMLSFDPPPPVEVREAARSLRYRDLITVCLIINRADLFPDEWIYVPEASVDVARIHNYKNWSADLVPDAKVTSLGLEYYCNEGDNRWSATDYDLAQLAIRESVQLGLIKEGEIKDAFVVRTPKALPIYDLKFQDHLEVIKQWVGLFANLQPLGRNGLHRYNNQDHAAMTAKLAVRNIQGGNFDCWKVTSDAEYPVTVKT